MYEALGSGQKSAGNNQIQPQCLVYTIPSSPAAKSGSQEKTLIQFGPRLRRKM